MILTKTELQEIITNLDISLSRKQPGIYITQREAWVISDFLKGNYHLWDDGAYRDHEQEKKSKAQ